MKYILTLVCLLFASCATPPLDEDHDGVSNAYDVCSHTPYGAQVDMYGCALDSDMDGVIDLYDACAQTSIMDLVTANGCKISNNN